MCKCWESDMVLSFHHQSGISPSSFLLAHTLLFSHSLQMPYFLLRRKLMTNCQCLHIFDSLPYSHLRFLLESRLEWLKFHYEVDDCCFMALLAVDCTGCNETIYEPYILIMVHFDTGGCGHTGSWIRRKIWCNQCGMCKTSSTWINHQNHITIIDQSDFSYTWSFSQ